MQGGVSIGPIPHHVMDIKENAKVVELVDTLDLGSSAARRESSSLSFRTSFL
jgi:hypothetical protein